MERCTRMSVIQIILSIIYVILGVAISVVILMQEGKSQGLGALGGIADSYWGKNKGRSMEGALEKFTKYGAIVFMVITILMNLILKSQGM